MDKDIIDGNIGSVGKYEIDLKNGMLIAVGDASSGPISVRTEVKLDVCQVLDVIAAKIPGTLDDMVIELAKKQLKN